MSTALERIKKERLHKFAAYLEAHMTSDYETCPKHGDTLRHAEDIIPDYEPRHWPWDDRYEHLVCSVGACDYEVWA